MIIHSEKNHKSMSNKLFPLKVRGERKPSFTEERHLIFVERRTELENQHIINTKTITDSVKMINGCKNHQIREFRE